MQYTESSEEKLKKILYYQHFRNTLLKCSILKHSLAIKPGMISNLKGMSTLLTTVFCSYKSVLSVR